MSLTHEQLPAMSEEFVQFDKGGNLVFCVYANEIKLRSILTKGVSPLGGERRGASYFPNVVSLAAVGTGNIRGLTDALDVMGLLVLREFANQFLPDHIPPYYRYALALNPSWVVSHIRQFIGVGESVCDRSSRNFYRVNALRDLPLVPIKDWFYRPIRNEVHYTAGILPVEAINGVVIDEEMMRGDEQYGNFVRADLMLQRVLTDIREDGFSIPTLAIFRQNGKILNVV